MAHVFEKEASKEVKDAMEKHGLPREAVEFPLVYSMRLAFKEFQKANPHITGIDDFQGWSGSTGM